MKSDHLISGENLASQCLAVKLNTGCKYKRLPVDEQNAYEKFGLKGKGSSENRNFGEGKMRLDKIYRIDTNTW